MRCACRLLAAMIAAVMLGSGPFAAADEESELFAAFKLARQLADRADYTGAAVQYERALALAPRVFGADGENTAVIQNNLANLYRDMGQFDKAEPLHMRSLRNREARLGPNHPDVAASLGNLANLYSDIGQYAKAEAYYERSLKIREARLGPNDPDVAESLNNLANLYAQLGQYSKAAPLYGRSLKIREATLPADDPIIAEVLNNMANMLSSLGDNAQAESFYKRTLKIRELKLGPNHPLVASTLNNLAILYAGQGKHDEAEPLYVRSLKIREATFGPNHPEVAEGVNNLAALYWRMHQFTQAEPLFARGLKIMETNLVPDHPDVAQFGLHNQALLDVALGRPEQAADKWDRARRIVRRHVARTLPMLSAKEQLIFLNESDRRLLEVALSLALLRPGDARLAEQTASWLANGKAVAQESLSERAQLARDARDPKLVDTAKKLLDVRTELAALVSSTTKPGGEAARQTRTAALNAQEQELGKMLAAGRGESALEDPWVEIADLRRSLPAGTVLVNIARIGVWTFAQASAANGEPAEAKRTGDIYVAWIVPPADGGDVRIVTLGSAETIESAVGKYQLAVVAAQSGKPLQDLGDLAAEKEFSKPLAELARSLLDPLLPHLKEVKELVLSPDAGLWLIPWAALPVGENQYAVERWQLRFVVAGRELALEKRRGAVIDPGPARVLANPDYDQSQRDALDTYNATLYPNTKPPVTSPRPAGESNLDPFGARSASVIGQVARLPGTAVEATLIANNLKELTQAEPRMYLDRNAQEGILKLIRNPRVLVLSTHGFFLPDQKAKPDSADELAARTTSRKATGLDEQGLTLENPLLRCGLLLAGCNQRNSYNDPKLGDGVMTGLEIVGCDFRGTELVVLSACETGLGQVHNGEGVAGLRQAFQLAGARSVVSTLWQIPDRQSAVLMNDFFTNLAAGQTKAEALRNAQLAMIKSRREKLGAAHPLFWAAWTLTGN